MEQYACATPCGPIRIRLLQCPIRTEFQGANDEWEFWGPQSKISMGTSSLRGHAFYPIQIVLQTQKESPVVLRNISDQGNFGKWHVAVDPRAKFNYHSRSDGELKNSSINWYSNLVHILIWEMDCGLIFVGFIPSLTFFEIKCPL